MGDLASSAKNGQQRFRSEALRTKRVNLPTTRESNPDHADECVSSTQHTVPRRARSDSRLLRKDCLVLSCLPKGQHRVEGAVATGSRAADGLVAFDLSTTPPCGAKPRMIVDVDKPLVQAP